MTVILNSVGESGQNSGMIFVLQILKDIPGPTPVQSQWINWLFNTKKQWPKMNEFCLSAGTLTYNK